jgi:hypothetical protein
MFFNSKKKGDLLTGVAESYSLNTLKNSCEFAGILASYPLRKHLMRGLMQYYVLQSVLARDLYVLAMLVSDRFVSQKFDEERRGTFMNSMVSFFVQNASQRIAKFLSDETHQFNPESFVFPADDFKQNYNLTSTALTIKMNGPEKSINKTITEIFGDTFLDSYGQLLKLDEENTKMLLSWVRDFIPSCLDEFQKDLSAKMAIMDIDKHLV